MRGLEEAAGPVRGLCGMLHAMPREAGQRYSQVNRARLLRQTDHLHKQRRVYYRTISQE